MPFNEDQKRTLLTNLARDKAENLRNEIERAIRESKDADYSHLSPEDRARGEYALQRALEAAQRLVSNLEAAMKLSKEMTEESRGSEESAPPDA